MEEASIKTLPTYEETSYSRVLPTNKQMIVVYDIEEVPSFKL